MSYDNSPNLDVLTRMPLLEITDFQLERVKKECIGVDQENKRIYEARKQKFEDGVAMVKSALPTKATLHIYLKKYYVEAPACLEYQCETLIGKVETARLAAQREEKRKADEQNAKTLKEKAVMWLIERGFVLGTDFNIDNAIKFADDARYEELKAEFLERDEEVFMEFEGQNCDDNAQECRGWDGRSHRCECCGRRVDWASEGNFLNMRIYGEAY